MKVIDYISDTHFDTHLQLGLKEDFERTFKPIFKNKQSDTLIIAGDIGEHNTQNLEVIRLLRDEIGYKNIIMVLGNHDFFLCTPLARETYNDLSVNRVNEFKDMIEAEDGLRLLDGNIIEIDGIRIGGSMGWYDGEYIFKNLNKQKKKSEDYVNRLWAEFHPDFEHIRGCLNTYDEFLNEEMTKLKKIHQDSDVIVSHINPSTKMEHAALRYQKEDTSGFFCFDGTELLKYTKASHWIFGHSHTQKEFKVHGVKCVSNPFGYPGEWNRHFTVRTIEV